MSNSLSTCRLAKTGLLLALIFLSFRTSSAKTPAETSQVRLPVVFEANRGQAAPWVRYLARTHDGEVALASDRIVVKQSKSEQEGGIALSFVGSNANSIGAEDNTGGIANYYSVGETLHRIEGVPLSRRVRYSRLYPGIDLVFHGHDGRLEYDFELLPEANPGAIQVDLGESSAIEEQSDKSLIVRGQVGQIQLQAPRAYQKIGDSTSEVRVSYIRIGAHRVGFELGSYDRSKPLLIDPVVSYASSFSLNNSTSVSALAVDSEGDLIITGATIATNYPVVNGPSGSLPGDGAIFVTKFDATGQNIVYSTYLEGGAFASSIAIDSSGDAFVAGQLDGVGFPLTSHALGTCSGTCMGGYVTKLDPNGTIVYSTLLSSGFVVPHAITIDASGNAVVAGDAEDGSLLTVNAYQAPYLGGSCAGCVGAFFAKLNSTGTGYLFSSNLGANIAASSVALDSSGNIYLTGPTTVYTPVAPLTNELESGNGGFFLSKFSPDGQTLLFGTMIGENEALSSEGGSSSSVAVGQDGTVYLAGTDYSASLPYTLTPPVLSELTGASTIFVMAFDPSLTTLKYSTTFESSATMQAMAVDAAGDVFVTGTTMGQPIQPTNAVVSDITSGGFFGEIDPSGKPVEMSSFGGLAYAENLAGIALDASGNIYISGTANGLVLPFNYAADCTLSDPILVEANNDGTGASCNSQYGIFYAKIAPSSAPQIALDGALPFLALRDVGTADLHISGITFGGSLTQSGGTCGKTVPAGTSCILTPTDANGNTVAGTVTITSDATPSVQTFTPPVTVNHAGYPAGPLLFADVSQLRFSPQVAGAIAGPKPMILWNPGTAALALNSIAAEQPLTETNNCPGSLAPGANCTVEVSWDTAAIDASSSINIGYSGNAPADYSPPFTYITSPTPVQLSDMGWGGGINFENQTFGNVSLGRTVTMTNFSTSPVTPPQVSLTGDPSISITGNTCSGSLSPMQSCVVNVAMSNTVLGYHAAVITFSGSASQQASLWGTVIAPQTITASPSHLQWSPTVIGNTAVQKVTLTNTSSSSAAISGFSFGTSEYTEADDCTAGPLSADASCTVNVTFAPASLGQLNDAMTVNLGSAATPLLIFLAGQGQYELSLSPSVLDFGDNNVAGTASAAQNITLRNLTNTAVGYSIAVSGPFSETTSCANPVAAMSICNVAVTYNPTAAESDTGTFTVSVTGLSTSNSISLFGAAMPAPPPSFDIGASATGSLSATVASGQEASYSLAITGANGFSGVVALTCSGAPAYANCVPSSSQLTITAGQTSPFTVSVTTQVTTSAASAARTSPFIAVCSLVLLLVLPRSLRRRRPMFRLVCCLVSIVAWSAINACGGGTNQGGSTGPITNYTPAGKYNLTVTGKSGSVTASQTLVLTVQ